MRYFLLIMMASIFLHCKSDNKAGDSSHSKSIEPDIAEIITPHPDEILDNTISCEGISGIKLSDSYDEIIHKTGLSNVKTDSLFLEGDFQRLYTKLWPGAAHEINIYWEEERPPFITIQSMVIRQEKSPYSTANDIKIDCSLNELITANGGKPVNFYGFFWDYGGTITHFNNGRINIDYPCLSGVLQIDGEVSDSDMNQVAGDAEISSEVKALQKYKVTISQIRLTNPKAKK